MIMVMRIPCHLLLLRLSVATQIPGSEDAVETLPTITTPPPPQAMRLSLLHDHDGWRTAAAVATV